MTNGASSPKSDLWDEDSKAFEALVALVASGKQQRGHNLSATEGRVLFDWVRAKSGPNATWATFWDLVGSVLPKDVRRVVASEDAPLYCAAVLLGYIDGIDYETPIPNGNGMKFGDVETRGSAGMSDRKPTVRERKLSYAKHGVARKAFLHALCTPALPEDLNKEASDIRVIARALAGALEDAVRVRHPERQLIRPSVVDKAGVANAPPPAATESEHEFNDAEVAGGRRPSALIDSPDTRSERTIHEPQRRWRDKMFKHPWIWWPTGTAAVAATIAATAIVLPLTASAPGVEIQLVSAPSPLTADEITWSMPEFWLPADNAFEDFPDKPTFDCHDPDIRRWIATKGILQQAIQFRIRNLGPEIPLSVESISLQGENSPATPGFILRCADGGRGGDDDGEIHYSSLSIEAENSALAEFPDRKAADFQRTIEPYSVAGIYINLDGEEDFAGTIAVDTKFGAEETKRIFVPELDDPQRKIHVVFHGIPENKLVKMTLNTDETLSCEAKDVRISPCSLSEAKAMIAEAWENE